MFLLPEINLKLRPVLLKMKPGTRIISTTFTMQNWAYDDMVTVEDKTSDWTTAYFWIVPANVEGTWKLEDGELILKQQFQMAPLEYRNRRRMAKAMDLVANSRLSIKEIGANTGFDYASHFSLMFKKSFGLTPSEALARFRQ